MVKKNKETNEPQKSRKFKCPRCRYTWISHTKKRITVMCPDCMRRFFIKSNEIIPKN